MLRVLSFNISSSLLADGWNAWPLRRPLLRAVIARARPTLAAFQEVLRPQHHFLVRTLAEHAVVRGHATAHRLLGPHNPVFFSSRALALDRAGAFWLGPHPELRERGWDARFVRGATWLALRHQGRPLIVMNVHLDHRGVLARARAVELILERLRQMGWPDTPAILCGDFNTNSGTEPHATLLRAGLRDAYLEAGGIDGEDTITIHRFVGRSVAGERRVDWIFVSGPLAVRRAEIVRFAQPPTYPSDHYPVQVDLTWADRR